MSVSDSETKEMSDSNMEQDQITDHPCSSLIMHKAANPESHKIHLSNIRFSNPNQANVQPNLLPLNPCSRKKRNADEFNPVVRPTKIPQISQAGKNYSSSLPADMMTYKHQNKHAYNRKHIKFPKTIEGPSEARRLLEPPVQSHEPPSLGERLNCKNIFSDQSGLNASDDSLNQYHDWKVILRNHHSNQVVLFNQQNHELAVASGKELIKSPEYKMPSVCRLCNQPLPDFPTQPEPEAEQADEISSINTSFGTLGTSRAKRDHNYCAEKNDFVDSGYFRCLAISHSRNNSRLLGDDNAYFFKTQSDGTPHILNEAAFNQGYYKRFFIEEKKLGRGARGNVFLCQHVLDEIYLGRYAVKKVTIGNDHTWLARMLKEVHMLERLNHANIVDYKHAWLENYQPTLFAPVVPCLFILMECANGGNLEEYVRRRSGILDEESTLEKMTAKQRARFLRGQRQKSPSEKAHVFLSLREILSFFLDICHGLSHLHRYSIVHRDLKPPNLLLSFKNADDVDEIPKVLISDFGECEDVAKLSSTVGRTGATGTLEFMAPELLVIDSSGDYTGEHSPKADMWSLGMVLYYLCYSELPYRQLDDLDLLREEILALRGPIKFPDDAMAYPRIPSQFKRLISLLLSHDPQRRPSVDEILANARDVDLQQLVPGHYYPTSLDSLTVLSRRNSPPKSEILAQTSTPLTDSTSSPPTNSSFKCDSPLLPPKNQTTHNAVPHINFMLVGIKMATILFPCYPKSAHLMASVPLTAMAIWGLQSKNLSTQICLVLFHTSLLTFLFFTTGSICGN